MAAWSYFHNRIMPRVIGCPLPVVDAELRNSAAEFLSRTRAWREWLDPVTVGSSQGKQFDLDIPQGSMVVRLEAVTVDGTPRGIEGAFNMTSDPLTSEPGTGFSTADRLTVISSRSLTDGTVLQFQVSLNPAREATSIPDHIARQYEDAIINGALYRIRTLPGQAFTDDQRAVQDLAFFEREVGRVAALVYRSHSNTMPRMRVRDC